MFFENLVIYASDSKPMIVDAIYFGEHASPAICRWQRDFNNTLSKEWIDWSTLEEGRWKKWSEIESFPHGGNEEESVAGSFNLGGDRGFMKVSSRWTIKSLRAGYPPESPCKVRICGGWPSDPTVRRSQARVMFCFRNRTGCKSLKLGKSCQACVVAGTSVRVMA